MTDTTTRPSPGTVGYLAEGGKLVCVRIQEAREGKLVTQSIDAKERIVAPRRLLWMSATSVPDLKGLAAHWTETERGAAGWDAEGAWEHLAASDGLAPRAPEALFAELPARFTLDTVDALVLAVFDEPLHFRMRAGAVHPLSKEAMEVARAEAKAAAEREAALQRALGGLRSQLAGEPVDPALKDDVDTHIEHLITVALNGQEAESLALESARGILNALERNGQGDPRHFAFSTLVALGVFQEHENLALRREEIGRVVSESVGDAARRAASQPWSREGRTDYSALHAVAIDAPHTTEVDDAFALQGNRLVVFIADAAAFVTPEDPIDEHARQRASTLYLPDEVIPMLPAEIGQGCASLAVGEDRPALAMSFRVDAQGQIEDFKLEEAICRLGARVSYEEADGLLKGQGAEGRRTEGALIRMAQRMMSMHRSWRVSRGALQLQRSEVDFEVAADGQVSVESVQANGPARQLISEMMISACAGVASWCIEHAVPSIFRCQARPTDGDTNPQGQVVDPAQQAEILRRLQPTLLTTQPGLHFTLALDAYTQVSSPLRRYSDLVMHRQLKASLRGDPLPYDERSLRELCQHIERQSAAVRRVENESRRYWTLQYLAQNPEMVHTAVCIRPVGPRWLVAIEAIAQRALIRTKRRLHAGLVLAAVVDKVDARRNKIVMREAE